MNNVKTDEPAIKITTPDGIKLTPVKPLFTPEREKQLMDSINSPESQNYFANKAMEEFKNNLDISSELKDIPYRNPNETLEKQAEEYLKEINRLNNTVEEQTKQIAELQEQLAETPTSKISRRIGDSVWGIIGGVALAVILYFIGRYFGISL